VHTGSLTFTSHSRKIILCGKTTDVLPAKKLNTPDFQQGNTVAITATVT